MSTEYRETLPEIQNIAEIAWFVTSYQGEQNIQLASLIYNFMVESVDRYLPSRYVPEDKIKIASGRHIEKTATCRLVLGFEYLEEEMSSLPTLARSMHMDWDNNRWALEAQEIGDYQVVSITHQGQTIQYYPPSVYPN